MRYGLMYAVGHVCALLLPAWNEMPSLTPARNPSSHASALTSRSWAARAASYWAYASWDETMTYPSMSTSCVANMYSSRTSFRLGSLIVLVSFRQVGYHGAGDVQVVRGPGHPPGVTAAVAGDLTDPGALDPMGRDHPRQLVHVQGGGDSEARPVQLLRQVLRERLRRCSL